MTSTSDIGVLLTNLGTPDAPTAKALRRYLGEFLWDPRVVEAPRPLWWLVLNGIILRTRPKRSAEAYEAVWEDAGSPLLTISKRQVAGVAQQLNAQGEQIIPVELGMRYGNPSIASSLDSLADRGCRRILVLPLYPQYSASTTASTFDAVGKWIAQRRDAPAVRFVRDYHVDPGYIDAMAASIRDYWQEHGRGDRLLMSFHGIPKEYADKGDPYPQQCDATARAIAERLELADDAWQLTFQSRFGPKQWLQPYTDKTLKALGKSGAGRVDMVCPGFSVDCLETLEENNIGNRELFLESGGKEFHYIPCLNDRADHIQAITSIVQRELGGWATFCENADARADRTQTG